MTKDQTILIIEDEEANGDGQVTNSVRIMENADLSSVNSYSGDWSEDSNTAYITTSKDNHEHVGNIAVFKVNNYMMEDARAKLGLLHLF